MKLVLVLFAFNAWAQVDGVPLEGKEVRPIPGTERQQRVERQYRRSVERYNAEVLRTGSMVGREAIQIKEEMDALKVKSDAMRRQLGAPTAPVLSTEPAGARKILPLEDQTEVRIPPKPKTRRETFVALAVVIGLALAGYGLGIGAGAMPKSLRRTVLLKCPGCSKKLRVPKSKKRVRVRCPSCGSESAYNPNKKKK